MTGSEHYVSSVITFEKFRIKTSSKFRYHNYENM